MLLAVVVLTLWRRKVWKSVRDLTVKMARGVKFHPERFLTVKSLILIMIHKKWKCNPRKCKVSLEEFI